LLGVWIMASFFTACFATSGPKMSQMTARTAQLNEITVSYAAPPMTDGDTQVNALNLNDDTVYHPRRGAIIYFSSFVYRRLVGDNPQTFISLTVKKVNDSNFRDPLAFFNHITEIVKAHYAQHDVQMYGFAPEPIEQIDNNGRTWLKYALASGMSEYCYATPIAADKYLVFAIRPVDFLDDKKTMEKSIQQGKQVFRTIKISQP
jgi:hypothetical protein